MLPPPSAAPTSRSEVRMKSALEAGTSSGSVADVRNSGTALPPTPQSSLPSRSKAAASARRPTSSRTMTAAGSRSSWCATACSNASTSLRPDPRENLCSRTPHWPGKGAEARKERCHAGSTEGSTSCARSTAEAATAAPAAQPSVAPSGPSARPRLPSSAHEVEASPSWARGYRSSSHSSKAALAMISARNDLPEPDGPVKCSTQSAHVARGARPTYDSSARRTKFQAWCCPT
mmetsp:Transcript_10448/g.34658  ORF Transcript_10448/g.34658 Transcript_10448/m.34658 type:complete len:233 (+) Transcript_10448:655-1353(+)